MPKRNVYLSIGSAVVFALSIVWANWLVKHIGPIRVWPFHLVAPAGVYVVGLSFLARDVLQRALPAMFADSFRHRLPHYPYGRREAATARTLGQFFTYALVMLGAGLSAIVAGRQFAWASAAAFAASEGVGLVLFWWLGGVWGRARRATAATIVSGAASAALDSYVFLTIAFGSLAFFDGQFVAKLSVTLVTWPVVLLARRTIAIPPAPVGTALNDAGPGEMVAVRL